MSLAGWYSGKFKAVKLCQSSSISGPSLTLNPMLEKILVILFFKIDIGCLDPNVMGLPGRDKSP